MTRPEIVARLRAAGCVFAEDEAELLITSAASPVQLEAWIVQRADGRPLEQILGWVEFDGHRIAVEPGVFVPRRRTELLVRVAMSRLRPAGVAVEMCCGAAPVGVALVEALTGIELYAADVDPVAVACARRNLSERAEVFEGDLFDALPITLHGRVDLLVANAPYVPTDSIAFMPPEARDHEPLVALDGGPDGLDLARQLVAGAPEWVVPGGYLCIETSALQAPTLTSVFAAGGFEAVVITDYDLDATVVAGQFR